MKVEVVIDYANSASARSQPAPRLIYSTNWLLKGFKAFLVVGTGRPERGPSPLEHLPSRSEVARRGRSSQPPADPRWRPRDGRRWAAGASELPRNAETAQVDGAGRVRCTVVDAVEERTDLSFYRRVLAEKRLVVGGLGGGEEKAHW